MLRHARAALAAVCVWLAAAWPVMAAPLTAFPVTTPAPTDIVCGYDHVSPFSAECHTAQSIAALGVSVGNTAGGSPTGSLQYNCAGLVCGVTGSSWDGLGALTLPAIPSMGGAVVSLSQKGAKCDGTTDDTAAIQAWLNAAAAGVMLVAPAGNCVFKSALTVPAGGLSNVSIAGVGPGITELLYEGANTTNDLLTIGDGTNAYKYWFLSNLEITSTTVMTGGAGVHFKLLARSRLTNFYADAQDGLGRLNKGAWFDGLDFVVWDGGQARAQADAIEADGTGGLVADLLLSHLKVLNSGTAVHVAGGLGGLILNDSDLIQNTVNFKVDHSAVATGNREIILGSGAVLDSATSDNIQINDSLSSSMTFQDDGWNASGGAVGLNIISMPNGHVELGGPTFFNFTGDAIKVQDATTIVTIGGRTQFLADGGLCVDATVATSKIFSAASLVPPLGCSGGNFNANAGVQNLTGASGYQRLADGRIHFWGTVTFTGSANSILTPVGGNPVTIAPPAGCPNGMLTATLTLQPNGFANGAAQMTTAIVPNSLTAVNVFLDSSVTVTSAQGAIYSGDCD